MRNSKLTRALVLVIAVTGVFALCVPTIAAGLVDKTINVSSGLNIVVNGENFIPRDVQGKELETFVYNGSTYIPLRAVSQALGYPVDYDPATLTAYVGVIPGQAVNIESICPNYDRSYAYTTNTKEHPDSIRVAGDMYVDATCFGGSDGAYTLYNLHAKYNKFNFKFGHIDESGTTDATLRIYLDDKLVVEHEMKAQALPYEDSIDLTGCLQMKIEVDYHSQSWGTVYYQWAMVDSTIE